MNAADPNYSIAEYMTVGLRREYTGAWWNMHVVAFFKDKLSVSQNYEIPFSWKWFGLIDISLGL